MSCRRALFLYAAFNRIHSTTYHKYKIKDENFGFQGFSPPILVFVQSKDRAKELFNELIYDGINVDVIHADRTQAQVWIFTYSILNMQNEFIFSDCTRKLDTLNRYFMGY